MKPSLFAVLIAALVSVASAGDYLTNFAEGQKKASKENKNLLVKFTGSDWCQPCIKLDKDVFSKDKFRKEVEKDFVVVVLDFPQKKKLPEAEAKANKEVKEKYKPRGFPTVLLMDSKGKVFKSMTGYDDSTGVDAYLKTIKKSLRASKFK